MSNFGEIANKKDIQITGQGMGVPNQGYLKQNCKPKGEKELHRGITDINDDAFIYNIF